MFTMIPASVQGNVAPPVTVTWNPADKGSSITLSNGNLGATNNGGRTYGMVRATLGKSSGKWYWEVVINQTGPSNYMMLGIALASAVLEGAYPGQDANGRGYYQETGAKYLSSSPSSYGASFTDGDVIGFALDMDAQTITCYKNGVSQGVMFSGLTAGTWFPAVGVYNSTNMLTGRFRAADFTQPIPSGFSAIGA